MEARAITKNVRMAPGKVRELLREIQGMKAVDARDALAYSPRKSAHWALKTLNSAIANAENNHHMNPDSLVIKEAVSGDGVKLKRFRARARGSAGRIVKRWSRITITVTDEAPEGGKS